MLAATSQTQKWMQNELAHQRPAYAQCKKFNAKSASSLDKNTGGFVGFNYTLDSILLGIEISGQYDVAKVKANSVIAGTKGYVELYKLMEYRLRVGYP